MYPGNKLAKLKQVNDWLRDNCERAWDIEPDATLDESRLRLHSRFCSFVTQMICKPIKEGCTIYCVNFSKSSYLYTWEWYTGTTEGERPQGQPTDTTPIDGRPRLSNPCTDHLSPPPRPFALAPVHGRGQ